MKNLRALSLLFTAKTISGFSQGISMVYIPWHFHKVIDEPVLFARLYLGITFVSLFWGLYVGTLVDKYPRKYLFMSENLFGGLVYGGLGLYMWFNGIQTALVGLAFACTFFIYNIHYPTLYAFAQELIEKKNYGKISTLLEIQGQLTTVGGGAVAALLMSGLVAGPTSFFGIPFNSPIAFEAWTMPKVFLLDGFTYLLSFFVIGLIRYTPTVQRKKEKGNVIEQLKLGLSFLRKNPLIFVFGNAAYFIFVTIMVTNYLLMPNFISGELMGTGRDYALSEFVYAFGAFGAGLSTVYLFRKTTTVLANIVLTLLGSLVFVGLFFTHQLGWLYALLFLLAISNSGSRIMRVVYILKRVPNQVIGRSQSVFFVINVLFRLLFIYLFSLTFFVENVRYSFALFAMSAFAAAVVLLIYYKRLIAVPEID